MTDCKLCQGSGWIVIECGDVSGVKECSCREADKAAQPAETRTPVTMQAAVEGTEILCEILDFPPRTEAARAVVAEALYSMCDTVEQLRWLVRAAIRRFQKWPGVPVFRQLLCSRYTPKDGLVVTATENYPDGLPSERPLPPAPRLPALPEGHHVSADPQLEAIVGIAVELTPRMPAAPRSKRDDGSFVQMLRDTITGPLDRDSLRGESEAPVVQAKVAVAVRLSRLPETPPVDESSGKFTESAAETAGPQAPTKRITQADIDEILAARRKAAS